MTVETASSRSVAGIVTDAEGRKVLPSTVRSDGTERKERKVRPGFTPLEDIGRFRSPRVAERAAREGSPQLGAGLGGRSLESWANDALKDQGLQASPLRGSYNAGPRPTPPVYRTPSAQTSFPSLASLGNALPSSSSSTPQTPPHLAPVESSSSSAATSPPRRPWPTRAPPSSSSSTHEPTVNPTPITSTHFPTASSPPSHSHRCLASDLLDAMPPPSPAAYSKTRRLQSAPGQAAQPPSHNVQSDWNAAKHCFTPPKTRNSVQPRPQRRPSATSSANGEHPGVAAGSVGASMPSSAPPSAFNQGVNGRRPKGHRRTSSLSSKSSASGSIHKPSSSVSAPLAAPISIEPVGAPIALGSTPPLNPSVSEAPKVVVNLPRSRLPPRSDLVPAPDAPASATSSTYNNKPVPTGPRSSTITPAAVPPKRETGTWGSARSMHAPKPPSLPSVPAPPTSTAKPSPPHLESTPASLPSAPSPPVAASPTPALVPTARAIAPLAPAAPPPPAAVTRPPRAKTEGGSWGLKAKSAFASTPTSKPEEEVVEVAVKLPPAEEKLLAPHVVQAPPSPKKKTRGERAKAPVPAVVNGKPPGTGMGFSIKGAAAAKREQQKTTEPEKPVAVPSMVVVEAAPKKEEVKPTVQEAMVPDDLVDWSVPISGRSWADDDDDSF